MLSLAAAPESAEAQMDCQTVSNRTVEGILIGAIRSVDPRIRLNAYDPETERYQLGDAWYELNGERHDLNVNLSFQHDIGGPFSRTRTIYVNDLEMLPGEDGVQARIVDGDVRIRFVFEDEGTELKNICHGCRRSDSRGRDAQLKGVDGPNPYVEWTGNISINAGRFSLNTREVNAAFEVDIDRRGLISRIGEVWANNFLGSAERTVRDIMNAPAVRAALSDGFTQATAGFPGLPDQLRIGPNTTQLCWGEATATARTEVFSSPAVRGHDRVLRRLDWCDGRTGCGQPAADRFCQDNGFDRAARFEQDTDIGVESPTYVPATRFICSERYCDGFSEIECVDAPDVDSAAGAPTRRFENPRVTHEGRSYRVDACRVWGNDCGEPAADRFCQLQGYAEAAGFAGDRDVGARTPTLVIDDRRVCDQPACDSFSYIVCAGAGLR